MPGGRVASCFGVRCMRDLEQKSPSHQILHSVLLLFAASPQKVPSSGRAHLIKYLKPPASRLSLFERVGTLNLAKSLAAYPLQSQLFRSTASSNRSRSFGLGSSIGTTIGRPSCPPPPS